MHDFVVIKILWIFVNTRACFKPEGHMATFVLMRKLACHITVKPRKRAFYILFLTVYLRDSGISRVREISLNSANVYKSLCYTYIHIC